MAVSNVWIICVVHATGLRSRGKPVANPFEFDDVHQKIDPYGHRTYLNQTPVSSLQHNLTMSVQQEKVDNGTAEIVEEPSPREKMQIIQTDARCAKLRQYQLDEEGVQHMSCAGWKTTLDKATDELWRQGALILADAAIAAIFFGAGLPLDPAKEVARTVGVAGVAGGGLVNAANASTGDDMVHNFERAVRCTCAENGVTSGSCQQAFQSAQKIFRKITEKHKAVKFAKTATSVVALGAPIVGMALDLFTGFLSLGSGTAVGGIVGISASACGAVLNTSHVIASCTQLSRISCCYKAVCPTTTTTTTTT